MFLSHKYYGPIPVTNITWLLLAYGKSGYDVGHVTSAFVNSK